MAPIEIECKNSWAEEGRETVEPGKVSPALLHGKQMLLASCKPDDDGGTVFILDSDVFPSSVQDLEEKSRVMIGINRGSSAQIGVNGKFIAEIRHIPK